MQRPGQSIHNYGLAVDICLIIDGKTASWDIAKDWDGDRVADWQECVRIFNRYGWEWGGNWKTFKDYPHFERKASAPDMVQSPLTGRYFQKCLKTNRATSLFKLSNDKGINSFLTWSQRSKLLS